MRWAWLSSVAVLSIGGFIGARSLQPAHSLPPAADKPPEAAAPITAPQEQEAPAALEPEIVRVAVDSAMTREEALADQSFPAHVVAQMELIDVQYYGFAGELRQGQIVVHRDLAEEVREIFEEIRESRFPIEMVVPIVRFGWCEHVGLQLSPGRRNAATVSARLRTRDRSQPAPEPVSPSSEAESGGVRSCPPRNPDLGIPGRPSFCQARMDLGRIVEGQRLSSLRET
jgi:hypothetical protein